MVPEVEKRLGLKQFRLEGCISYLVYDLTSRGAFAIDPHAQLMDDYREYLAEQGLKPVLALDTHVHADHLSATHFFRAEYGCEIAMSSFTSSQRVTRKLRDGEELRLGEMSFKVLDTPGHTRDSISLFGGGMVFTGDTLLIGSSGRTDFGGSDPAAEWKSIHGVLSMLPDETLVFPGHDYSDLLFSTIGTEKKKNPHWLMKSENAFIELKTNERIENPSDEIRRVLDFNLSQAPAAERTERAANVTACGTACEAGGKFGAINVEKYASKLEEHPGGVEFVDVREPDEFRAGHIPGVRNIPLSEIGFHLKSLLGAKRVYFSCQGGRRSSIASKTLTYIGHPDIVNVTGGLQAWNNAGLPVEK